MGYNFINAHSIQSNCQTSLFGLLLLIFGFVSSVSARPGDLDPSFGAGGKVIAPIEPTLNDGANKVAVQTDGKIVAAGSSSNSASAFDFTIARFNTDGSPDASFGTNGVVITALGSPSYANGVVIQPDGKILIAGTLLVGSTYDFALYRYNSNGSPDSSFGTNGLVTTPFTAATNDVITGLALQSDGKIVVAGSNSSTAGNTSDFAVARYNPNGSLDATFDGDGKATTQFNNSDDAGDVIIRPDGKIAVGGSTFNPTTNQFSIALALYNIDGSLDQSFDGDGKVTTPVNSTTGFYVNGLAVQPDGKLIVAGAVYNLTGVPFLVTRYNTNGSLDASFDGDGRADITFGVNGGQASALVLQPNGKIVVGGAMFSAGFDFALARLNADGSYDIGFGTNGRVVTSINGNNDEISSLALQTDGKIVAAGYSTTNGNSDFTLARYEGGDGAPPVSTLGVPFDFDGDGRADVSVFRPSNNTWYVRRSGAGFFGLAFGTPGDLLAPANYDGDGKTDIAVYRPSNGTWYIFNSTNNTIRSVRFGGAEDLPRPADFDADGQADINVFRPSTGTWYRLNSSNNLFVETRFGGNGDIPLPADFDGDRRADINVFRPSSGSWYRLNSTNNEFVATTFGINGDIPAPADYDADGKTDIAVFRPSNGTWYRLNSSNNAFVFVAFGANGDIPAAADYDGDARADVSVFRPSNGTWYRLNSTSNALVVEPFGANGDTPVPSAFTQ